MRSLILTMILTGALLFSPPDASSAAPILKGRLAALDIKQAQVDKGGKPIGEMTIAWHAVLSPRWLDPQSQSEGGGTRVALEYFVHDALVKNMPQGKLTLSLAEQAEMLADFTKAAFRLRPGLRFQDGTPLTTEDVKWSYENYKGIRAAFFKEMTERIELVDERTIIFHFKQAFVDFMYWYSGGETGIGFVVPSRYYQQVGEAGFIAKPIGAGPFKVAAQPVANELHFEAWGQYWRRVPGVEKIIVKSMPSLDARTAAIKTGAVDVAFSMTGTLNAIKADPNLRWVAKHTSPYWLTFPNWEDAKNPFHDKRVRQAVSLAINRGLLVQQGTENLGMAWGNWVGKYVDSADLPLPEFNPDRARKLLADAGFAQGLKFGGILPFPPAFADGERVATHLQAVGMQGPLERTDLPKFLATRGKGKQSFAGKTQILLSVDLPVSLAAQMMEDYGTCKSASSFICDAKLDSLWKQYTSSKDVKARHGYSQQMQRYVIGEYLAIPLHINALVFAVGPKVLPEGNPKPGEGIQKYWATQSNPFPIPWEDWQVKIQ